LEQQTCNSLQMKRLLFVVNDASFFLMHLLPWARAARAEGYEIDVATPERDVSARIQEEGFSFHPIPMSRQGMLVWEELSTVTSLFRLYRMLRPDLVVHVTIKPVLYGGIIARLAKAPAVVNAVVGLGYVFVARGHKARLLRTFVKLAYRFALGHPNTRVIFQNPDDRAAFLKDGLVNEAATVLIKGVGVDTTQFAPIPQPDGIPLAVLASRMLWHKGVGEFVEAAQTLLASGVRARFVLVGDSDPGNPSSVSTEQLKAWQQSGAVEWWGHRMDMSEVFAKAHIICLPSYREGMPKVLIEAAACGRPIVATDAPGCREIVRHNENGLLVAVRDSAALANALRRLIEDPELRRHMGVRGRQIAEKEFCVEKVTNDLLAVHRDLSSPKYK